MRAGAVGLAAALTLVLAAGCERSTEVVLPPVPSTVALLPTTTSQLRASLADESLPTLPGTSTTTTTVSLEQGTVTLTGLVTGPDGPVGGATVRIERIVGDQVGTKDVVTAKNGRYTAARIKGGRLRVRAWRSPDVAGTQNVVVFASGTTTLDLEVRKYGGTDVQWAIAPRSPTVGQLVNLVVQLSTTAVGADGLAGIEPLSGVGVSLTPLGVLQPAVLEQRLSDADGRALFTLSCNSVGSSAIDVTLATGEQARLEPPSCGPLPTTTTIEPPIAVDPGVTVPDPGATVPDPSATLPPETVTVPPPPISLVPVPVISTTVPPA